ncbi:hypothetical protein OIDMADRAFT_20666 [Oidiodendron maius Zn]|uniref:Uncharacterized protein n=1 Tax=Oidiodendron maius (strain Zn) TaxID=913774 RepID=A0A0C3CD30_OIDMZ|nr:hypothetical protein OIDMADRAFT_20666 [Oidiodendron maius Zn]
MEPAKKHVISGLHWSESSGSGTREVSITNPLFSASVQLSSVVESDESPMLIYS